MKSFINFLMIIFLVPVPVALSQGTYMMPDNTWIKEVYRFNGNLPKGSHSIIGFSLNKSSFSDIRDFLGNTSELPHSGDPHESYSICYKTKFGKSVSLIFESGWPENPKTVITSFTISSNEKISKSKHCSSTTKFTENIRTDNGLGIGLTQKQLISILGTPSQKTSNWVIYSYENYIEYTDQELKSMPLAPSGTHYKGRYLYDDLFAHFTEGKIDWIGVYIIGETDW